MLELANVLDYRDASILDTVPSFFPVAQETIRHRNHSPLIPIYKSPVCAFDTAF
jgi:hypothetical protein